MVMAHELLPAAIRCGKFAVALRPLPPAKIIKRTTNMKKFFVILYSKRPDFYFPLEDEDGLIFFETEREAREAALAEYSGKKYVYQIFEIP